ncbi:uncharacterized protein FTOL_08292 [Fusarium torulosum]|uniref:Uncharacterized protein n=1 Tax=Fusarium torulosum TaxID=33205 RepID=A0AAE8MCB3_9HYPO|nr:uncharacterized protein FTOL_08292 [Fusarium torulosum]
MKDHNLSWRDMSVLQVLDNSLEVGADSSAEKIKGMTKSELEAKFPHFKNANKNIFTEVDAWVVLEKVDE